ncbi:hypothetical protein BD410DRAFT_728833, partial [Rickenella mellea]
MRPRAHFLPQHLEFDTHILRIRHPNNRLVPVPIGPSLPRRDRAEQRAKHCRLMLIFFKPWRHASHLRLNSETWADAFQKFAATCAPTFLTLMDNMQILHECKDSRDDHFAKRRSG